MQHTERTQNTQHRIQNTRIQEYNNMQHIQDTENSTEQQYTENNIQNTTQKHNTAHLHNLNAQNTVIHTICTHIV